MDFWLQDTYSPFELLCPFTLAENDCPELLANPESWPVKIIKPVPTILTPFRM